MRDALHTRVKRALAMVSSHYLGIDLSAISEGYVIGNDDDEAQVEVQKLADNTEAPGDALASFFDVEVVLPLLICQGLKRLGRRAPVID